MYYGNESPTELYDERHELLMRAARRRGAPETVSGRRRYAGFLRRSLAL